MQHELPGVGENLIDHPESIIIWELNGSAAAAGRRWRPTARSSSTGFDRDPRPDLMYHTYQLPFTFNTERLGYPVPEHCICMTPNIPRSRSVGRMWLLSKDPAIKPALDFRYFTDEEGYDEQTIVDGLKIAREVANTEPFKSMLTPRGRAGAVSLRTDEELSPLRPCRPSHGLPSVGHVPDGRGGDDELAVVDPELRVRGVGRASRSPTGRSSRACPPSTRWSAPS